MTSFSLLVERREFVIRHRNAVKLLTLTMGEMRRNVWQHLLTLLNPPSVS